ncbi:hypothetical protein [Peribacillus simplex]|uniref:hypothetical protein n=1 Tax=Peribacillus simplex TaxID=1478 RepID=UPI003336BE13
MKMRILKKDGSIVDKTTAFRRTPHQQNLKDLDNNPSLKADIQNEVLKHIGNFIIRIKSSREGYMHSADIAFAVCKNIGLQLYPKNYGLVGSCLFEGS